MNLGFSAKVALGQYNILDHITISVMRRRFIINPGLQPAPLDRFGRDVAWPAKFLVEHHTS